MKNEKKTVVKSEENKVLSNKELEDVAGGVVLRPMPDDDENPSIILSPKQENHVQSIFCSKAI